MKYLLLTLLALPTLAFAQDEQRHVRFIPLGELPEWEETLVDGVRVGGPIAPGALPPSDIAAPAGDDKSATIGLTLRQPSTFMTFGPKVGVLNLADGKIAGANAWLTVPMPKSTLSIGALFRDPNNMSWLAPKILMLSDDAADFPLGNVRFVNVSSLKVIVQVGKKPDVIAPGEVLIKPLRVGANPIVVGYYDRDGKIATIFKNEYRLVEGQRIQAFLFKGQGAEPRSEVKLVSFPEPIPRP